MQEALSLKNISFVPPPPNNLLFCLPDAMFPASPLHSFLFSRPPFLSPHPSFSASDLPPSSLLLMPPPPPAREEGARGSTHRRDNYVAVPLPPRPIQDQFPSTCPLPEGEEEEEDQLRSSEDDGDDKGQKNWKKKEKKGTAIYRGLEKERGGAKGPLFHSHLFFPRKKTSAVRFPPLKFPRRKSRILQLRPSVAQFDDFPLNITRVNPPPCFFKANL